MSLKKTPITQGNARFTVFSPGCVRMEYAKDGQFSPFRSVLVGSRAAPPISADWTVTGKTLTLRTDRKSKRTRNCLAGEVKSPWAFCEFRVESSKRKSAVSH